jgi:cyclase
MAAVRLIARLDVKGPNLIKGVHLEGLRVVGDPHAFAVDYYAQGIDELIYMDTVASLYGRNNLSEIVRRTVDDVFIPITVGGGVRSVDDARELLRSGADKIAVNTAALRDPELLTRLSSALGSQSVILSIEAKRAGDRWVAFTDNGREPSDTDVVAWAARGAALGAGEILLTSVDREGTRKGFDLDLVRAVRAAVDVPIIASGGMGATADLEAVVKSGADAAAIADMFHFRRASIAEVRAAALAAGLDVREV